MENGGGMVQLRWGGEGVLRRFTGGWWTYICCRLN